MKYRQELVTEICGYISGGSTNEDACALAGISEQTFYRWINEKSDFSELVKKALLAFKQTHVAAIAGSKHWQARAWLLERKFPNEFRPPKHVIEADVTTGEKRVDDPFDKFLREHPELTDAAADGFEGGKE